MALGPSAERAFNRARDINQQLRQYPVQSRQYHQAILDICSNCQEAIKANDRHGDAHVLLSNAHLLLHIDVFPVTSSALPIKLAAAIIQHWHDQPMRQRPWTKNVDNGWSIYHMVSTVLSDAEPSAVGNPELLMRRLKGELYREAISSDSLMVVRDLLDGPE